VNGRLTFRSVSTASSACLSYDSALYGRAYSPLFIKRGGFTIVDLILTEAFYDFQFYDCVNTLLLSNSNRIESNETKPNRIVRRTVRYNNAAEEKAFAE